MSSLDILSAPHDKRKACANELKPSLLEFLQRVQPRLAESNWIATCCKTEESEIIPLAVEEL